MSVKEVKACVVHFICNSLQLIQSIIKGSDLIECIDCKYAWYHCTLNLSEGIVNNTQLMLIRFLSVQTYFSFIASTFSPVAHIPPISHVLLCRTTATLLSGCSGKAFLLRRLWRDAEQAGSPESLWQSRWAPHRRCNSGSWKQYYHKLMT